MGAWRDVGVAEGREGTQEGEGGSPRWRGSVGGARMGAFKDVFSSVPGRKSRDTFTREGTCAHTYATLPVGGKLSYERKGGQVSTIYRNLFSFFEYWCHNKGKNGAMLTQSSITFNLLFCLFDCYLFIYLFIYLFLAALGLHCCTRAFSSCGERGLLFVAVHGL